MSEPENRRSDASAVFEVILGGLQLACELGWGLVEVSVSLLCACLRG